MRDPNRIIKILMQLSIVWSDFPDMRLGQFILNAINEPELYYIEDEELIEKIKSFYGGVEDAK